MRHAERAVESREDVERILMGCEVMHLALYGFEGEAAGPYAVPVNFGYRDGVVYIHTSPKGRKAETLRQNPEVSFSVEKDVQLVPGETGCKWSARFRSVVGFGRAEFIEESERKMEALDLITSRYAGKSLPIDANVAAKTAVVAITVREMTGVVKGYEGL